MRLTGKRMRVHARLFASLLGVVGIVCGLGVGLVGYLGTAATHGVRAQLAGLDGADLAFQISLRQADDAAAQDIAVREVLAEALASDGRSIAISVTRTLEILSPLPLGDGATVVVQSVPDLPDVGELVDGRWPTSPAEATLQADAAETLGIAVGDTVDLGTTATPLVVTGTWQVRDEFAPRWIGDALWVSGSDRGDAGPLIIDESVWAELGVLPRVAWTVTPDVTAITRADLAVFGELDGEFARVLRAGGELDTSSFGSAGRLPLVARQVLDRLDGLAAVQPLALIVVGSIALLALVELARLLAGVRAKEIELLWSRGATPGRIAGSMAGEAGVTAALGAGLGTAAALGVVALTGEGVAAVRDTGPALWAVPVGATLVSAGLFWISGYRAGRRSARRDTGVQSGRARTIAGAGAAILVTVGAVVSTWQLRLYGSPLTPASGGGTQVDPVAVLAPALVVVALVLVGLIAFPRVAALVERSARARSGVVRALTARNVGRRPQFAAAPIVLVSLAAAQLVVAAAYDATWTRSYDTTSELRTGAPVQAQFGRDGAPDGTIATVAGLPGVTAVAPAAVLSAGVATEFETLVAATPSAIVSIANTGLGTFDAEAAAAQIAPMAWGPQLPAGDAVALTVTGDAPDAVTLRLTDAAGATVVLGLTSSDGSRFEADLPAPTTGAWMVQAIDLSAAPALALDGLVVDGAEVQLGPWWVSRPIQDDGTFGEPLTATAAGLGYSGAGFEAAPEIDDGLFHPSTSGDVRMVPSLDGTDDDSEAVPAVISQSLADEFALSVGDTVPVALGGFDGAVLMQVVGVQPAIPGSSGDGVLLIDLRRLEALQLRNEVMPPNPGRMWVATTDAAATVAAMRDALPVGTRYQSSAIDPSREALRSAVIALWAAALGGLALAVLAVGAATGAQLRDRREEVVVLRAVGLESRRQAAIRRRELLAVLGYGVVAGVVAGGASAMLTLSALARAAVPGRYGSLATVATVDPPVLAIAFGLLIVALLIAAAAYGRRVRIQARTLSAREVML